MTRQSSHALELLAAVLACMVALGALAHAMPHDGATCVATSPIILAEQASASTLPHDAIIEAAIKDMLPYD